MRPDRHFLLKSSMKLCIRLVGPFPKFLANSDPLWKGLFCCERSSPHNWGTTCFARIAAGNQAAFSCWNYIAIVLILKCLYRLLQNHIWQPDRFLWSPVTVSKAASPDLSKQTSFHVFAEDREINLCGSYWSQVLWWGHGVSRIVVANDWHSCILDSNWCSQWTPSTKPRYYQLSKL